VLPGGEDHDRRRGIFFSKKEDFMEDVTKKEFDALKKKHEDLEKSYWELLEILTKVTDGLRGFVDTQRMPTVNRTDIIAARMRGHYEIFNDSHLKISHLKYGR
jgi:hypothetical protein